MSIQSVMPSNNLGLCFEFGKGTTQNYEKAFEWYLKAAEQGHAKAQYMLGCCYFMLDYTQAVHWWRKAAEQGLAEAQEALKRLGY